MVGFLIWFLVWSFLEISNAALKNGFHKPGRNSRSLTNDSNFLKRTNFYIVKFKDFFFTKIADIWARGIPTFVAKSDKTFYKKCMGIEI